MRSGRVTRLAEFGAFVELEPGIEGLAHASTFPPTGRPGDWAKSVPVGTTAAFEILSVDLAQKRIGVALVAGRSLTDRWSDDATGRIRAWHDRDREGGASRKRLRRRHVSPRDIKPLIKENERKKKLGNSKRKGNSQELTTKKLSKCSQAYGLFLNGKTPVRVAMDLNLDFQQVRKYWLEYLRLNKMKKLYNIYIENEFHLDYLFKIYYFMLRNEIPKEDCEIVLRNAHTVINLNNSISNLKSEYETWQRVKNNHDNAPLEPLPKKIDRYYPNYHL